MKYLVAGIPTDSESRGSVVQVPIFFQEILQKVGKSGYQKSSISSGQPNLSS